MSCICYDYSLEGMRCCQKCHRYWMGAREFFSVSKVIRTVYPKKSFDLADPIVVEHARERGSRVDAYLSIYAATGSVHVPPEEWEDVKERLDIAINWWDKNVTDSIEVQAQPIFYSEADGIAGCLDFCLIEKEYRRGLDLKTTYSKEKDWILQVGAAAEYGALDEIGILHVSPKVHQKVGGCRLWPYDLEKAKGLWRACVGWFHALKDIDKKAYEEQFNGGDEESSAPEQD